MSPLLLRVVAEVERRANLFLRRLMRFFRAGTSFGVFFAPIGMDRAGDVLPNCLIIQVI